MFSAALVTPMSILIFVRGRRPSGEGWDSTERSQTRPRRLLYITARHMAVFLRHDLGVEDAGDDDRIITRLERIGGERIEAQEWDRSGRDREHKVTLVLYRLPDPDEGGE